MPCECTQPGFCPVRNQTVTRLGLRICQAGDERSQAAYFTGKPATALRTVGAGARAGIATAPATARSTRESACVYLGAAMLGPDGTPLMRDCPSCRGTVRLKVKACAHPGHAGDPTTTDKACRTCRDYAVVNRIDEGVESEYNSGVPNGS